MMKEHQQSTTKVETTKSWRKINEERKVLKKQRKQERLLKNLQKTEQEAELNAAKAAAATTVKANPSTISIAVPGSILENAQSAELRSYVAGQIARAACIFRVNEVIVFDDVCLSTMRETKRNYDAADNVNADEDGTAEHATVRGSSLQLARILQYLECPQYLRKFFFPMHKDLKYAGLLNPLDAPHHLRQQNSFPYREGVVLEQKKAKAGHSYVNVGLLQDVLVNKAIEPGLRVTVKLDQTPGGGGGGKKQRGTVVSPLEPRRETGVYWGYNVRIAHTLPEIFTRSPYDGGYDLTIGTSDRGGNVHELPSGSLGYNHLLIVFGGLQGLEAALTNDDKLSVDDPALLFDHYLNVLPKQGSRTIRTEEALLIAMATLQEKFKPQIIEEALQNDLAELLARSDDTGLMPGTLRRNNNNTAQSVPAPRNKYEDRLKRAQQQQVESLQNEQNADIVDSQPSISPTKKTKFSTENRKSNPFNNNKRQEEHTFDDTASDIEATATTKRMKAQNTSTIAAVEDDMDFEVVPSFVAASNGERSDTGRDEDLSRFD